MFNFEPFLTDTYAIALSCAMLLAMIYLCLYYGLYHFRVGRWRQDGTGAESGDGAETERGRSDQNLPPVSVVLTAHNDAAWLRENLVYLLEQEYPDFEVVVVNYLSSDDSDSVLKLLHDYYPHLKVVPFLEDVNLFQGKKYPLSIGIKSAKNDILLLADPECTPKNLRWLRGMVAGYEKNEKVKAKGERHQDNAAKTQIVLGYCGLKLENTLLGWLQQYDALAYGGMYLGSALLGNPYTGSGRNLSYRRSFFFKQGAFISHYDVADGSDDRFIYQNATRANTRICIDADAVLTTEPKHSHAAWLSERRHRVGTRNRHKLMHRLRETMPAWAAVLYYAAAVLLLVQGVLPWPVVATLLAMKIAWQTVCFAQLAKRFDGGLVYLAAAFFEIYFVIANTILILLPLYSNRKFK